MREGAGSRPALPPSAAPGCSRPAPSLPFRPLPRRGATCGPFVPPQGLGAAPEGPGAAPPRCPSHPSGPGWSPRGGGRAGERAPCARRRLRGASPARQAAPCGFLPLLGSACSPPAPRSCEPGARGVPAARCCSFVPLWERTGLCSLCGPPAVRGVAARVDRART